jgi:mono/diheme cytochrome c family protein
LAYRFLILLLGAAFLSTACSQSKKSAPETLEVAQKIEAKAIYDNYCSSCHGVNRLGATGPALIPQALKHLRKKRALDTILNGRAATQMPGFALDLKPQQVENLIQYIYTPLESAPDWGMDEIKQSHILNKFEKPLSNMPRFKADPLNIFLVVEHGDHHVSVLDGDTFKRLHRFKSRYSLHGGIKYSPDGRYAYLGSRDGWVSIFDVYNFKIIAEIRAGLNTRNIAVSSDGRYVMVGNYLPHSVVILDAKDLKPLKVIEAKSIKGESSRVSAVYTAPPRESFIVALKDIPEVWEISWRDDAKAPYTGLVHDYRPDSGEDLPNETVKFPIRRIKVNNVVDDFFFDPAYRNLIGASRDGNAWVVNLLVGRPTHQIPLSGMPHLGSGISWMRNNKRVIATPNLKAGKISIINAEDWTIVHEVETLGPGFFLRSHENSQYVWADVFFGPNKDVVHVIDKNTFEIVKTLRPVKGKTSGHIEFTRDGRYALLSIWDPDGALIIYDAQTLKEFKRIPMKKPSGKYNIYNKIKYSDGTSH